jgi:hypothetical protein
MRIAIYGSLLTFLLLTACGTDAVLDPVGTSADTDAPTGDLDGLDDTDPGPCQSNEACAGQGVCDLETGACVPCLTSDDCPGDQDLCIAKQCVPQTPCVSDKQCASQDMVCDLDQGVCVMCLADVDCVDEKVCKAKTCVAPPPKCASSKECADGLICDKLAGYCVECVGDDDCDPLQHCLETVCVPDVCQAGAVACANPSTRKVCSDNGSVWTEQACGDGTSCVDGACKSTICVPDTTVCDASGKATQTCSATGTELGAPVACPVDQVCKDGQCNVAQVCEPAAKSCQDQKVVACNAAGTALQTVADCTLPDKDGKAQTCLGGACVAVACTAGAMSCADTETLATCKADGQGFVKSACGPNKACENDACRPIVCTAGAKTCEGTVAMKCSAAGTTSTVTADCALTNKVCQNGICMAKVCAPGALQCQAGSVGTCKADGTGWTLQACPVDQVCASGKCAAKVCEPETIGCNGAIASACNGTGSAWVAMDDCGKKGETCVDGACLAVSCQAGTIGCKGKVLALCNAQGTGVTLGLDCGAQGQTCDAGKCVAIACSVDALTCQNGQLASCNAAQSGWDLAACPVNQVCSGGKCLNCVPGTTSCSGDMVATCQNDGSLALAVCDDGNTCTTEACSGFGQCKFSAVADGTPCPVGNGWKCKSGKCATPDCPKGTVTILVDVDGQKVQTCGAMGPIWGQRAESPNTLSDKGNGTIADAQTGLTWQKDHFMNANWQNSRDACDSLDIGGQKDWRLPTVYELASLVDWKKTGPSIDKTYFPTASSGAMYWTVNPRVGTLDNVWTVFFSAGGVHDKAKTSLQAARCVRGSFDTTVWPRFTVSGDGKTATDNWTSLVWNRATTATSLTWFEGKVHCAGLGFRVPQIRELHGLLDYEAQQMPYIDTVTFPDTAKSEYWAANELSAQGGWEAHFAWGEVNAQGKDKKWAYRCVK